MNDSKNEIGAAIKNRTKTHYGIYSDIGEVLNQFSTEELTDYYINTLGQEGALFKMHRSSYEIMQKMEDVINAYQNHPSFSADFSRVYNRQITEMIVLVEEYRKLKADTDALLLYIGSYTDQDILQCEVRDKFYERVIQYQDDEGKQSHKLYRLIQDLQEAKGLTPQDAKILSWYENYIISKSREIHQVLRSVWELVLLNENREDITSKYM